MSDLEDKLKTMKFPPWSALILAPLLIFAFSFKAISNSKSPITLGLIVLAVSIVCGIIAWGLLVALAKIRK